MDLLDNKLGGTAPLDIVINAPKNWVTDVEEESFDDDFGFEDEESTINGYWWNTISLEKLEQIHDYLDSLPEIGKVLSVASGIKVATDLVGYKIIRKIEQYNPLTYSSIGNPYEVEYTICGYFHDDKTDINNYYVSFATIKPTVSGTDSNFTTNIYNLQYQSAGMWVAEEFLN